MVDLQPLAAGDFEPPRVEAEQVQDRGVQVRHIVTVVGRVEAQLVGRTVGETVEYEAPGGMLKVEIVEVA